MIAAGKRKLIDSCPADLSERCKQNIRQEVARCKSLLAATPDPPSSSSNWLPQGFDPRTRQSLAPLLNSEAAITGGAGFRESFTGKNSIFQVSNTFNRIENELIPINESSTPLVEKAVVSAEPVSQLPSIPLYPDSLRAVLRHWVFDSPNEGYQKALVRFSKEERNAKRGGQKTSTTKKLYSKRKTISLAFLLFSDRNGVDAYEKAFGTFSEAFMGTNILKLSTEYLRVQNHNDSDLRKWICSDSKIIQFTERVARRIDLRKHLFNE